jgi:hypothetical protein
MPGSANVVQPGTPGLNIWNGYSASLGKRDLRSQDHGSKQQISERQNHVEILPHVTVMKQVMAIQAEENSGAFHMAFARKMHAPVEIFVNRVVNRAGQGSAADQSPLLQSDRDNQERHLAQSDQYGPVPPGHGDGVLVFFINEVIRVIGFEDSVMNQSVALERITELSERHVHEKPMQQPLEKRGEHDARQDTDGAPKQE